MPKSLSLKKQIQQSGQLKSQTSIKQFFKNHDNADSQPKHNQLDKEQTTANNKDIKLHKRKASSPVLFDNTSFSESVDRKTKSPKKIKLLTSPYKNNNENIKIYSLDTDLNSITVGSKNTCRSPLSPKLENGKRECSTEKVSSNDHNNIQNSMCNTKLRNLDNSPSKDNCWSPKCIKLTPEKVVGERSPSIKGFTVTPLKFTEQLDEVGDVFGEEWEIDDVDEFQTDNLDLTVIQRCEVINVVHCGTRKEIKLRNGNLNKGTCFIDGFWVDTPLAPGDIVAVIASRDSSGQFCVSNTSGLLVLHPDHLLSSTTVVAGVFCKRKAVLQDRFRGLDSANSAMTIGIIIHELVQRALMQNIIDVKQLTTEAETIIKESIQQIFDAGITEEEVRNNMKLYILSLGDFMQTYFIAKPKKGVNMKDQKDKWNGVINKVLDIEENLCCPELGLKGKIDATLQVTIPNQKGPRQEIVPLELKSGKASMSAEHRGQLVLYGMMLSAQRREDPTVSGQRGLLLYLKDRVELHEISCGYPERRDLIMLRNQLVQNLATTARDVDPEKLVDIEEASALLYQRLPDPINSERICTKCPYLTICSLHLWHTDGPKVSESHPLSVNRQSALGHLSDIHIKYFLQWTTLLKMEERGQILSSPLHTLWTDTIEKRVKRGTCLANLHLKCVESSGARYLHVFLKQANNAGLCTVNIGDYRGPQEGEYCIVSLDDRNWVAAGVIVLANNDEIQMLLERDLSRRQSKTTSFHIDTYESYATTVQNFTNLGVLLDDTDRSQRLRRLIIDRDMPIFEKKLPRDVGRLGTKLMRSLNIEQQRAVLRALAAKDYALLKGLPGTGKTQTVSVLIQMLVSLKQRVLVTAHTHSAVDTVLSRLPKSIQIMRLGPMNRVAKSLVDRCEQNLAAECNTTQDLERLYDSMEVVGVTCLGAAHAMLSRTTFDVCIIDEATQVLQSTVLRPLFAANRFILVGDPEQLPPVVRSRAARRLGMEESLFHRLMRDEATCTLQLQYRMNKRLADVANSVAYDGQLKCATDKVSNSKLKIDVKKMSTNSAPWISAACSPEPDLAAVFLDLKEQPDHQNDRSTCTNKSEACLVLALIDCLVKGGVSVSEIGVIAPYRDQVALLRKSLVGQAEVSTVDQFQGRDKPVIIYSCTRRDGQDDRKIKEGEVLNDQRRLAVSVTRAKHKLIVVGDSRALRRYEPLQRLIKVCNTVVLTKQDVHDVDTQYSIRVL